MIGIIFVIFIILGFVFIFFIMVFFMWYYYILVVKVVNCDLSFILFFDIVVGFGLYC